MNFDQTFLGEFSRRVHVVCWEGVPVHCGGSKSAQVKTELDEFFKEVHLLEQTECQMDSVM